MVFLKKNGIEMGIIGKIKHQKKSVYRQKNVCEQYPMLTSLSKKSGKTKEHLVLSICFIISLARIQMAFQPMRI